MTTTKKILPQDLHETKTNLLCNRKKINCNEIKKNHPKKSEKFTYTCSRRNSLTILKGVYAHLNICKSANPFSLDPNFEFCLPADAKSKEKNFLTQIQIPFDSIPAARMCIAYCSRRYSFRKKTMTMMRWIWLCKLVTENWFSMTMIVFRAI